MKFLSNRELRNLYNSGTILENRNNRNYVIIFSLCGLHFSSTKRRAMKRKQYMLDDRFWCKYPGGTFTKLKLIISGRVHLLKAKKD